MTVRSFRPSGLVTLLTDFGLRDPFVGLMKAQIYGRCRDLRIVDLTHELPAFRPAAGAFWLERARHWCPAGTVHVAVVDPGVGTARRLLAVLAAEQAFLGPDNGLLGPVLEDPAARAWSIELPRLGPYGVATTSATFHGRDVLAPLAAELAAARANVADLGPAVTDWVPSPVPTARPRDGGLDGEILLLDRYGNAFTNLPAAALATRPTAALRLGERRLPIVRTYGDAPAGSAVGVANSFGVLEVAVVTGDAGRELGVACGDPVRLEDA